MPFYQRTNSQFETTDAIELRQLPVKEGAFPKVEFVVLRDYWYGLPAERPPDIPIETPTDLASIPAQLWSIISSYGRQTLASVLHDVQCKAAKELPKPSDLAARAAADNLYLDTLREAKVACFRSRIMWSAVRVFGILAHRPLLGLLLLASAIAPWIVIGFSVASSRVGSIGVLISLAALTLVQIWTKVAPAGWFVAALWPLFIVVGLLNLGTSLFIWALGGFEGSVGPSRV